ncbi:unnamed protein product [Allacma fusca]|uniref:Uncharacterized protein n=1 Tax=Allacma fusca TaxID=39272 RepID=A0A8J2P704_9HEXA|nr:unnamed protein product [Allacma fusca]
MRRAAVTKFLNFCIGEIIINFEHIFVKGCNRALEINIRIKTPAIAESFDRFFITHNIISSSNSNNDNGGSNCYGCSLRCLRCAREKPWRPSANEGWSPSCAPMDAVTTYRASFVWHCNSNGSCQW